MIVNIECLECEFPFGIKKTYLDMKSPYVRVVIKRPFWCPYCQSEHPAGKVVRVIGISSGANIQTEKSNVSIGGDVVGGDLVRNG